MVLRTTQDIVQGDFINKAERNGTPSNDVDRVPRMESNGYVSEDHMEAPNAIDIVIGEAFTGATTPQPAYISKSDNKAYRCDANNTGKMKFVGFIISSGSTNDTERLVCRGLVRGFSGLDEGEKYYLSDTIGTISNTPGTNEVLVGIAVNSTTLLIQKGRRHAHGTVVLADAGGASTSQDTVVTLGFRPSVIRLVGYAEMDDPVMSQGTWINGTYRCIRAGFDESGGTALVEDETNYGLHLETAGASFQWTASIESVTDTGFTLRATQQQVSPPDFAIHWEAEGEI